MNDRKRLIADKIDSLKSQFVAINRQIFENPELCYEEKFAADFISKYLSDNRIKVKKGYADIKTALRGDFEGSTRSFSKGKVAILAEYDALANIGHACGHSLIAASAVIGFLSLVQLFPDLAEKIALIGTPAEEGGAGKVKMIENRGFDDIDAAIMIHPSNKTRVIARMYAVVDIRFTFLGKSSHAAAFPHDGINALDAAVSFYNMVSMMRQQLRSTARIHGVFEEGQGAPNIIPEKAVMRFYIRELDKLRFNHLVDRVISMSEAAAKSAFAKIVVERIGFTYDPFTPNYKIGSFFKENMKYLNLKEDENYKETDEIGSSDIGNLSEILPTLHPEFAIGDKDAVNHSRKFLEAVLSDRGIDTAIDMTKAMAMTVYDLISDRSKLDEVKEEFRLYKDSSERV